MALSAAGRLRAAWRALATTTLLDRDDARARMLRSHDVTLVVDCGANAGQYGQRLRRGGFMGRIASFEPAAAAYAQLERATARDPGWTCHRLALGATPGTETLNVA